MRISNQNNYLYPKQKAKQTAFKGYFACPIKELYIQPYRKEAMLPLIRELNEKCANYFKTMVQTKKGIIEANDFKLRGEDYFNNSFRNKWSQDNKLFLENDKLLTLNKHPHSNIAEYLTTQLNLELKETRQYIIGGNCFLGKKSNGDNFALIGEAALKHSKYSDKDKIVQALNIKPENLHVIEQPDFHLDMAIRPLNYPYILVNDFGLTEELLKYKFQKSALDKLIGEKSRDNRSRGYASANETIQSLKEAGFVPIRVPGIFGKDRANFMNAIVHQDTDGQLIYITNKSPFKKINFELAFKNYIKRAAPQIKEVLFIDGNGLVNESLSKYSGGIHCMSSERPDFEKWNELLKKANC